MDCPVLRSCILSESARPLPPVPRYARFSKDPELGARQMSARMEYLTDPFMPPKEPKPLPAKVAIYCQGKHAEQVDRQRSRCLSFVKTHFPEAAIEIFEDTGRPASELIKLRVGLYRGKFDAVVVDDLDRFGRNFNATQLIMARLLITETRLYTVLSGANEIALSRSVLWASVALLEQDNRVCTIGRDWWDEADEAALTAE